jgi:hypothetical protein
MDLGYNKYKLLIIATLSLWHIGCKNEKSTESKDNSNVSMINESKEFENFYQKFSTDSVFQLEHTVFPLEGIRSPKDSLDKPDPNFRWTRDNWVIHHSFDDANGTFSREFVEMPGLVSEIISDQSGQFSMERRFGKLSSGWHLIYYREMGKY